MLLEKWLTLVQMQINSYGKIVAQERKKLFGQSQRSVKEGR